MLFESGGEHFLWNEEIVTNVIKDDSMGWTDRIISDSDHFWYDDEYYYNAVANSPGLMDRKKREVRTIALYYWRLHDGGTERVTSRLASMWVNLGYRVLLLTDIEKPELDYAIDPRVERFTIPPHRERYVNRGRVLSAILKKEQVDVFVTNLWVETATAWDLFVVKSLGIPVVIGWHNVFDAGLYGGYDVHFFKQRLASYRCADVVVALSKMDQYWFSTQGIASRLIHNPLTFKEMTTSISPLSSHTMIWLARVEQHQKRIYDVVRMMPLVVQRVPDAVLVVVGDGPDRRAAEKLAQDLGVASNIQFVGYSSQVEKHIMNASVHVMTSDFEGSPMVLGEVWSHGVPTVMYDLAFLEWLREGRGHIAVPQKNYEALAEEVSRVLLDEGLRHRLGAEARSVAQKFFDIDIGQEWKTLFEDISTQDSLTRDLTEEDVVAVAPILVKHLATRMYEVDSRKSRHEEFSKPKPPIPLAHKFIGGALALGHTAANYIPRSKYAPLKTVDFAHIGLGDNLMAWVGLHALLCGGYTVVAPEVKMYVPHGLSRLARFIFGKFGVTVEGVDPHTNIKGDSPVFSPLPPGANNLFDWYKTFCGIDWRMNCFEAVDLQKSIPREGFSNTWKTRLRLNLSEKIFYKKKSWRQAEVGYIGYRLWLPIAYKMGLMPVQFMALIKSSFAALRNDVRAYVDDLPAVKREALADVSIFPAGKSFQAFSPKFIGNVVRDIASKSVNVYVQDNDPWLTDYRSVGFIPKNVASIDDLFWIIKSSKKVVTTDSFSSHVAQFLRDDFVLTLTRDFGENIVHPAAFPFIASNHPTCAPCNYLDRKGGGKCAAGFSHCAAFDSAAFEQRVVELVSPS